tara:strand:- start:2626 stop:2736 length:111 start_codon:yes stop_codon:yes gene_type:complete
MIHPLKIIETQTIHKRHARTPNPNDLGPDAGVFIGW